MKETFITIKHSDIDDAILEVIINLKQQHWHYTYESQKKWIENHLNADDLHVLMKIDGEYVAYLCICDIEVTIDDRLIDGKGLSNVCVDKKYQKCGYGKRLVEKANELIRTNDNVGVLLCHQHLIPFYEKCGWVEVKNGNVEVCSKAFSDVAMLINYNMGPISFMSLNRNF